MTKKHVNLLKGMGYVMAVAGACAIITAAVLANHIETYYTPKFDAKQLAQDKALLDVSIRAREMERNAVYKDCRARVMDTPYYKELEYKMDSISDVLSVPGDVDPDVYIWGTINAVMDLGQKMEDAVENAVNETPRIRELDAQIADCNKQIATLQADSVKCAEWNQMSRKEHIKQNWDRMLHHEKNNDRLLAHAYNNVKSY